MDHIVHVEILWDGEESIVLHTTPMYWDAALRSIAWALDNGHGIAFYVYGKPA